MGTLSFSVIFITEKKTSKIINRVIFYISILVMCKVKPSLKQALIHKSEPDFFFLLSLVAAVTVTPSLECKSITIRLS